MTESVVTRCGAAAEAGRLLHGSSSAESCAAAVLPVVECGQFIRLYRMTAHKMTFVSEPEMFEVECLLAALVYAARSFVPHVVATYTDPLEQPSKMRLICVL